MNHFLIKQSHLELEQVRRSLRMASGMGSGIPMPDVHIHVLAAGRCSLGARSLMRKKGTQDGTCKHVRLNAPRQGFSQFKGSGQ